MARTRDSATAVRTSVGMDVKKKCGHPDVWFDRSVEICGQRCKGLGDGGIMHDYCTKCGMSECDMESVKGKNGH